MISGTVSADREAIVLLTVHGLDGQQETIRAVIDTGFTDYLVLPTSLITSLGLPRLGARRAILADGNSIAMDYHRAVVTWHGHPRRVMAPASTGAALIGMALLYGSDLHLRIIDGGSVEISPVP